MSSVNQTKPSCNSVDSVNSSAIGLTLASTTKADYMEMIIPSAEKFYGDMESMPIDQ